MSTKHPQSAEVAEVAEVDTPPTLLTVREVEGRGATPQIGGGMTSATSATSAINIGPCVRTRVLPIPPELAAQVRALRSEYVFPGRAPGAHMAPNHVGEVLSRLLGPAATAHSLRHRYATRCYAASGHDLLLVSRLMGHATCATTQGYIDADGEQARRAVAGAA